MNVPLDVRRAVLALLATGAVNGVSAEKRVARLLGIGRDKVWEFSSVTGAVAAVTLAKVERRLAEIANGSP